MSWKLPPVTTGDTAAQFGHNVRVDMSGATASVHVQLPYVTAADEGKAVMVSEISEDGVPLLSPPIWLFVLPAPGQSIDTGNTNGYAISGQGGRVELIATGAGWTLGMHT